MGVGGLSPSLMTKNSKCIDSYKWQLTELSHNLLVKPNKYETEIRCAMTRYTQASQLYCDQAMRYPKLFLYKTHTWYFLKGCQTLKESYSIKLNFIPKG